MLLCLLFALATPLPGQSTRDWRPDDRVLITAFHEVGALASDARYVYVATRGGLLQYDQLQQRWALPITEEDGYPVQEVPTALAVDGMQADLWLGTAGGSLFCYRTINGRWETAAFALGGEVLAIVPARGSEEDGVWVQTRGGWHVAGRLSMQARSVPTAGVPTSIRQRAQAARTLDASLSAFRSLLGLDERARRWPIVAFTHGDRRDQYWFGTTGGFLFRFDALRQQSEWFWYGNSTRGVSALAVVADTLWLGGDGRGVRTGLVRATSDLQDWQLVDALDSGVTGRIAQVIALDAELYVAGADGVWRVPRNGQRAERVSREPAASVAVANGRLWMGTRSGVYYAGPSESGHVPAPAVQRIRVLNDNRIWLASADGIYTMDAAAPPDSTRLVREAGLPAEMFVDVAQLGSRIVAATADALFVREQGNWQGPIRLPAQRGLGRLTALAADGNAIWIGGANGLARYQPDAGEWLYYLSPEDLPAGPIDIAVQDTFVWLATPAGALRLKARQP